MMEMMDGYGCINRRTAVGRYVSRADVEMRMKEVVGRAVMRSDGDKNNATEKNNKRFHITVDRQVLIFL